MREIEELEREWKKYKLKQRLPVFIIAGITVSAIVLYLSWPFGTPVSPSPSQVAATKRPFAPEHEPPLTVTGKREKANAVRTVSASPTVKMKETEVRSTGQIPTPAKGVEERRITPHPSSEGNEKVVLAPDISFLQQISEEKSINRNPPAPAPIHHQVIPPAETKREPGNSGMSRSIEKPPFFKRKRDETRQEETVRKKSAIDIVKSDSSAEKRDEIIISTKKTNNTLEYLVKRFNQSRDPKLAAYIAQSFYKKKNYKEAIRWSIIANSLEPSNESSWLLYAKSKVALGQREDAVKALKIYLNQYPSRKVKAYLETLESGL